jgi:hypothetical protein
MFIQELLNFEPEDPLNQWIENIKEECKIFLDNYYLPEQLEAISQDLKSNLYGYIKVGVLAEIVKIKNLSGNFGAFCLKAIGKSYWWVERHIKASKVALNLINHGFEILPINEAQCRPLTILDTLTQVQVWENIVNSIPQPKITAKAVERFVNLAIAKMNETEPEYYTTSTPKPRRKTVQIKQDSWDKLEEQAQKYGLSPKDYLDLLLDKELGAIEDDTEDETETETEEKERGGGRSPEREATFPSVLGAPLSPVSIIQKLIFINLFKKGGKNEYSQKIP